MKPQKALATFSWDDGHPLDLRIARLFNKYGLKCTFYVPRFNNENLPTMQANDLKSLSNGGFDIHSHTYNHIYLNALSEQKQSEEISSGKKYVEDATGKEDSIFCYPGGKYTRTTVELVKAAGFEFARTVDMGLACAFSPNSYLMPTTMIVAPLTPLQIGRHLIKRRALARGYALWRMNKAIMGKHWHHYQSADVSLYKCYHFWGHSWEIEKYDLWDSLESLLQHLITSDTKIIANNEFYEQNRIQTAISF